MENSKIPLLIQQSKHLDYQNGQLAMEGLPLNQISKELGTPCYCYSKNTIQDAYNSFKSAFAKHETQICYAVKANSNLTILNLLSKLGSGFDVVSGGEFARVLKAGGDPKKIVFSGVGKTSEEIKFALNKGVGCLNIESESELQRVNNIAKELNVMAPISFRVNPDVDANTHPYISTGLKENKFGIAYDRAFEVYKEASQLSNVTVLGIDCHIGSQLIDSKPFLDALDLLIKLVDRLKSEGITLKHIDLGGGVGVLYDNEKPINIEDYATEIIKRMEGRAESLMFEPGRFIVANSGVMVTEVQYVKSNQDKQFAVVDAGMNDLTRPCLYKSFHGIVNLNLRSDNESKIVKYDVVGPVCETADFLGKERSLDLREGDLLGVLSAGAYTATMGSNYNTRARPPEALVENGSYTVIRKKETFEEMVQNEVIPE